jgi:hypothetical protein
MLEREAFVFLNGGNQRPQTENVNKRVFFGLRAKTTNVVSTLGN